MVSIYNVIVTLFFSLVMAFGQIIMWLASKDIFSNNELTFRLVLGCKLLWLAIFIYVFSMMLWLYILSIFDLKYAYPISSIAIFFVAMFHSVSNKTFPPSTYWVGLILVFAGLIILSSERSN
jgi:drug/metabolite transporter (DMT)-like permease